MQVTLPWPDSKLIPHARGHWAPKARATKMARELAAWKAKENGARPIEADKLDVKITLNPPDRRRRDRANSEAACKALIDGVADVVGVDDYFWRITWDHGEPIKGGQVVVNIEVANTAEAAE